ncbi:MAG: rRNA pseudouridine synthase [Candidatus Zixiibacteriota bacterium]|nr:MAG: rRNA pseudouridine synthase [candidate division Zixibacteria bacterium]
MYSVSDVIEQTEKLAKYLARCGVASRRKSEEYIRAGWVQVNGQVVNTPETRINPDHVEVKVRGHLVKPLQEYRYIIFNKPVGVLSTCQPSRERGQTILDLVKVPQRVFPAGRLDRDTSGLILLTDDGELVQKLIHPSYQIEREYHIHTGRPITEADLERLRAGLTIEDGFSRFKVTEKMGERRLKVILTEGRKRQIRRTLKAIDLPIEKLHRVRLGSLTLGDLAPGHWRDLKMSEIQQLKT